MSMADGYLVVMDEGVPCRVKHVALKHVANFREQIRINHGQTIERLNQRGGLTPTEIFLAANGLPTREWVKFPKQLCADWVEKQFLEVKAPTTTDIELISILKSALMASMNGECVDGHLTNVIAKLEKRNEG